MAGRCKNHPLGVTWPSEADWLSLNASIGGHLLRTVPVAASCWPNSTFESHISCNTVQSQWTNSLWHASQPDSIDYPIYANNSCLPPNVTGYVHDRDCTTGGLPAYIVNATTETQIATAMKWAADRNIRIVIKGTGHDLNGRSSGAFALSIWTHHLRKLQRDISWKHPTKNTTEDVYIIGSGQQWGNVLEYALAEGRVVTTGQDPSVGLGGYIQGGGHGPLSQTYGLAASHVLQMRVVTTQGEILVVNHAQHQDLFWALRGGGPGLYGVVTEYVLRHHPAPSNVTMGNLLIAPGADRNNISAEKSWEAAVSYLQALPDLMDAGLAGACMMSTGEAAVRFASLSEATTGVVISQVFWSFNSTSSAMEALVRPVLTRIGRESTTDSGSSAVTITFSTSNVANYTSFISAISGSSAAGSQSVISSRLLGRRELLDTARTDMTSYLKTALQAQNATVGTFATIGLQGGPGVQQTPPGDWGSPKRALQDAARWYEAKEHMWQLWAPESGAYMNEANPFDPEFKHDFYGANYDRLLQVKAKYDPTESLFVLAGVGSDRWDYDLDSGRLCRVN
ncbi:FAD-binding domain-containing protein [Aspergillus uvarum CBS 121591]|uniref:FAD-binding domain-containing protein n=1 Tax=Aspergillus uvarum CBS 121591 TaxID=1448315 RepID=A0A319BSP7_9EURO|nr:FAD-binding domain-containing protein [Aspergillus uvarum CBS 121591]PYH76616.1 FAD-binding domain-containing protein [Aspergillus uvarum CBS 121591]